MEHLALRGSDVHLWWIDLARCHDGASLLSLEERERAVRLQRADDRRRWIASRAALRGILARYVGLAPHDLALRAGAHGKPALAGGGPRFTLSRGGERALLAVAHCAVGVDLEPVDECAVAPADVTRLVAKVCSAQEAARLWALPEGDRRLAFLRLWVLKEAYLKGVGVGLGREPRTVMVTDGRDGSEGRCEDPDWTLQLLDAGPGWVAALAAQSEDARIIARHWPDAESGAY